MKRVKSTNLAAVGYDPARRILEVTFRARPGVVYYYQKVPPSVHKALMDSPSLGEYFSKKIRYKYQYNTSA